MDRRIRKGFTQNFFRYLPFFETPRTRHKRAFLEIPSDRDERIFDALRNWPIAYLSIKEARRVRLGFFIPGINRNVNDKLRIVLLRIEADRQKASEAYRPRIVRYI